MENCNEFESEYTAPIAGVGFSPTPVLLSFLSAEAIIIRARSNITATARTIVAQKLYLFTCARRSLSVMVYGRGSRV